MEDKLSTKESHMWTLSDFIERRKSWNQGDESRLANYLQQLSNKISDGAKNTLNELDDLVASIDDTAIQVANINNEFQLLADKQFIENKVQEEDETVQIKVEKPIVHEIHDADVFVNNIKEALKNSFKAIDNHFEKITVVVSDSDDDELNHEETILRPKIFYKKLNLPSLSGNIQSEIPIDITLSSDSDTEPPMDKIKEQESYSSDEIPEEEVHFMNKSKSIVETNHQTTGDYSNIIEPEKCKPKNISSDTVYVENDLFSPPPLLNDNDEDDLVNEYDIFSNGNDMYGERNLWDDDDTDDNNAYIEPPLPIYTDEPPKQIFISNTQEKVPSIQQTLNDELQKRFQKDNMSSLSDDTTIESSKIKLPAGAVNVFSETDSKTVAQSPAQNIKQAKVSQISKNVAEPIQFNSVSDIRKNLNSPNKLFDNSNQNLETSTQKNLREEIKQIKKPSLFEQESDDEDLFAEKIPNVIPVSKSNEPKQIQNLVKNLKESNTIFSGSDDEIMDSKSTTKEMQSPSIDKSKTLLDCSSDDDLFNIKSSNQNSKSKLKNKLDQVNHKSKSRIKEKNDQEILNKEIINEPKNNSDEPSVIEKESIRNNNTLSINKVTSSVDNKSKKLSYLFSSDEDDDIFFDIDNSNKNKKKTDKLISNSTQSVKNRNEKRYESKVELFDSSSDDEIFNTNKSNNNFNSKNINKSSLLNEVKAMNISKSLDDQNTINEVQETKNKYRKNLIEQKLVVKKHKNVFSLESDNDDDDGDDDADDYLSHNVNISNESKFLTNTENLNDNINTMSVSSEEYLTPTSESQYKDIFNNLPIENMFTSKKQKLSNEKEKGSSQNETLPKVIGDKTSIFSSSDDEQLLSINSIIHNVISNSEIKMSPSNLDSLSENVPIVENEKLSNVKNINSPINELLSTSAENIIQDEKLSILKSINDKQQIFLNSDNHNEESSIKIKQSSQTLDSLPSNLPITKDLESSNKKEINTAKNENMSSSFSKNKILDCESSIFSSSEDELQLSFDLNNHNEESNIKIKQSSPTSSPTDLPIIKDLESSNKKEINAAKNENMSSSSSKNKILDCESSIFSSSDDEQQSSFKSKIQNEESNFTNKTMGPTSNIKMSFKDSIDGSSFSSLNSKDEKPKIIPGKLSINAGAFINVASLLPKSKSPIITPKTSNNSALDEKTSDTLPTGEEKLFSAQKERAKIQVKRRPQSRKARQLAIAQTSSVDISHDQELNIEDSSHLNVSKFVEKDFVDYKSSPVLQEDSLESQNKIQAQSHSKLFTINDEKINVKREIKKDVKKSTLDLFDDDSDPFEIMIEKKSSNNFDNGNIEIKIGKKQFESKLSFEQHSEIEVNEKPEIESDSKNLLETKPVHDKQVKAISIEENAENNSKLITQSTILPTKSNSLFDDNEDLFPVTSEKVIKHSSNIFDSDDEFEFSHKLPKKNSVKTKSIFGDDSDDDDLFSSPSKFATSNLSNQKQINNLSQHHNRSSTDGYVKLTAESVAINPLDKSKNN